MTRRGMMISIVLFTLLSIAAPAFSAIHQEYFYYPQYVSSIAGRALAHPSFSSMPTDTPFMVVWDMGSDVLDETITWGVGDFTGYDPPSPVGSYQRGVDNTSYGSTSVQMQGYEAGIQMHSWSATAPTQNGTLLSAYYTVQFSASTNYRPWSYGATSAFRFSAFNKVPTAYFESGSGQQACGYIVYILHLTDTSPGSGSKGMWITVASYDSRGASGQSEWEGWDPGTNEPMIVSYFDSNRWYISLGENSNSLTGSLFSNWRYYAFYILPVHLTRMATDLNSTYGASKGLSLSTNPADYRLDSFCVGPEMSVPTVGNPAYQLDGHLGFSVRDVRLFTEWSD